MKLKTMLVKCHAEKVLVRMGPNAALPLADAVGIQYPIVNKTVPPRCGWAGAEEKLKPSVAKFVRDELTSALRNFESEN